VVCTGEPLKLQIEINSTRGPTYAPTAVHNISFPLFLARCAKRRGLPERIFNTTMLKVSRGIQEYKSSLYRVSTPAASLHRTQSFIVNSSPSLLNFVISSNDRKSWLHAAGNKCVANDAINQRRSCRRRLVLETE